MAGLHFDITGDNSNFIRKLHECENGVKNTSKQIEQSGLSIEDLFNRMTKAAAAFGAGFTAKELISNIVQVRGEFQQLEVAFKTMLGSEEKANALMQQLVKTAATTPFDLQGVANGAKQLLAYGENVENVNDDLIRLGNIAAGLSQPLGDIVYLYGTTMTQGRLYTQDLNQFTGRGIPMIRELAKQFGVAENEVKGLVEAGKVGFPEVKKVIMSLTDEGGMFFNLMQEQSKTITGQISNIEDAIATMFNEIGKANEGIINEALSGVSYLVENYEKVGQILLEIVGTYGAYRTALMVTNALQVLQSSGITALTAKEAVHYGWLVLTKRAQDALNMSMLTNPYVAAAVAVTALGLGFYKLVTYQNEAEKAQKKLNEVVAESDALSMSEQRTLARLKGELSSLSKGTDKYNEIKNKIVKQFGKYYEGLDEEITKVGLTEEAYNKLTEAINKSFGARQYEKFASQQQEEFSETMVNNLSKIQDRLYEKLGDETGAKIYSKIRESLLEGNLSLGKGFLDIQGLGKEVKSALDEISGAASNDWSRNYAIEGYIIDILKAQKILDNIDKKARERFGIENDNSILKGESTEEKKIETTYLQDLARAKSDWENAKKGYEALIKDQEATSKQVKEAKDKMDTAEKEYKDLGGITGSTLTSRNNKSKKEADERLKQQEQLSEQFLSLIRKNQQDEINLMQEGTDKKLRQIDLDYQKELDAIEKQREEWNKSQNGNLTSEQEQQLSISEENAFKAYQKSVNEVNKAKLEADKKAWQEYFIEFGSYQEKRKNLIQKYDDEISKLQSDSPEYAIKMAEKEGAIERLDEQFGRSTKAMADLFEDASNKSVSSIQAIIDKYELLISYMSNSGNVSLGELKDVGFTEADINKIESGEISISDVTDAIKGLKKELEGKSPFQAFVSGLKKGIDSLKNAGGDTKKIGQGITDIGNAITSFSPALKEFGSDISNIFGIDDSKIQGAIDALGGLGQTAAGVGQIMSGDIVGGAMSAVSGISSVVSALDGMFGADYSRYNEMVEEYTRLNEIWDELIDKKQEYIAISYGAEADKVGREAIDLVEKQIEAYRMLGKERLNSGASVGSHSIGVRVRKNMGRNEWEQWDNFARSIGWDPNDIGGRMTGLFDLTAEQLEKLKFEAPSFWAKMDGDVQKYLNGIIEGEVRIEDIQRQLQEQWTQITFDNVFDNFIDTLMDMKASSKDAAEDISEMFMRAMLSNQIGELYQDKLKKWYEKFAKSMNDGDLSDNERESLNSEYMQYVEEAMRLRDKLAAATGYDKISQESFSQDSTSRGFQAMSQDEGEELNGRFTALQISNEEIKNLMMSTVLGIGSIVSISTDNNTALNDILTQNVIANGYLEGIIKHTKLILEFGNKFDRMITIFNDKL